VTTEIAGQLNAEERALLTRAITGAPTPPEIVLEVGTWLGGGSTVHVLRALEKNSRGHLWGIEADRSIYDQMLANLRAAAPETLHRFTPLFGISEKVIPPWLRDLGQRARVDLAFLDGGNNPGEQMAELRLLDPFIPIGGQILAHDARMRKGKWLVPYLSRLDNWEVQLHGISDVGLLSARKIALKPSRESKRAADVALWKMRCNPAEIAATWLPSSVCEFCLRLLPRRFARRLSDGCK
jgi:predicted O-methyltransferase YrrM